MTDIDALALRLHEAGIEEPRREARSLIMAVTGIDPFLSDAWLAHADAIDAALHKRVDRVPLSKIVGKREFYGRDFIVSADVLDPRPDSETLIEAALKTPYKRVLDLGTGSGCLILTLLAEKTDATGVAVDVSDKALAIAKQNAAQLGVERCDFIEADMRSYTPDGKFDLLVSNPPYIKSGDVAGLEPEVKTHDPMLALDGGTDGCDFYRAILRRLSAFLAPGGHFLLEIAPDICENVHQLAMQSGCKDVKIIRDLAGRERVLQGVVEESSSPA